MKGPNAKRRLSPRGTYIVVLTLEVATHFPVVGKFFRDVTLPPGFYTYIGSAFGSGGVWARVAHHVRHAIRPKWNLDFVRPAMAVEEVWFTFDNIKRECTWAKLVHSVLRGNVVVPRFGSWDCYQTTQRCPTHFFHFDRLPSFRLFSRATQSIPGHAAVGMVPFGSRNSDPNNRRRT
jgi:Uri superfamily endonuclease